MPAYLISFFAFYLTVAAPQGGAITKPVNYIQGKVIDKKIKEPLVKAVIRILNSKVGVLTDAKGNYKLIIPDDLLTKKIVVQFQYPGYESLQKEIDIKTLPANVDAPLEETIIHEDNVVLANRKNNYIAGNITDGNKQPIRGGGIVQIKNTTIKTTSDNKGNYQLSIPYLLSDTPFVMTYSYIGFEMHTTTVNPGNYPKTINVILIRK